jgi:hypothetical protein
MRVFLLVIAAYGLGAARGGVTLEPMKHDIQGITAANFDGVISKFRDVAIASCWFYNDDSKADANVLDEYNQVASTLKGMVKITAMSCSDFPVFCKKAGVTETPHIMIYPTNPMPPFKYEGKLEAKAMSAKISKFITDLSVKVTSENVDAFLTTDPTKPKVLLFSDKKSAPTIWKALSSETVFKRTIKFGFVNAEEKDILQRFKVTKFPAVTMQRGMKAEIKEAYKGEMNFGALKEWVNLHSESGMGDKVSGAGGSKEEISLEEAKPWLVEEVPELTAKSQSDICFKGEGLCVIYLKDGKLSPAEVNMLTSLSKKFTSQLSDRGAKMKWMWMDLSIETGFKTLFNAEQMPSAVVFNPHKRLRFASMSHGEEGEIKGDESGLSALLDKVLGGDARFKMVPGQKLPAWAPRDAPKKKAEL